jgi:hypothetical protein
MALWFRISNSIGYLFAFISTNNESHVSLKSYSKAFSRIIIASFNISRVAKIWLFPSSSSMERHIMHRRRKWYRGKFPHFPISLEIYGNWYRRKCSLFLVLVPVTSFALCRRLLYIQRFFLYSFSFSLIAGNFPNVEKIEDCGRRIGVYGKTFKPRL